MAGFVELNLVVSNGANKRLMVRGPKDRLLFLHVVFGDVLGLEDNKLLNLLLEFELIKTFNVIYAQKELVKPFSHLILTSLFDFLILLLIKI